MAKRLSKKEKAVIVQSFTEGKTIEQLTKEFYCTKPTIVRNLKIHLGEEKYKKIIYLSKKNNNNLNNEETPNFLENKKPLENINNEECLRRNNLEAGIITETPFTEIVPLNWEIENTIRKDFSSVPIEDIDFPKTVYMIVDKRIELETKYLKEYPEWQFLSEEELDRKTIEIFIDLKVAKRFCNKDQKVIKVPNTEVFRIVTPFLLNKGITRIISADKLISL